MFMLFGIPDVDTMMSEASQISNVLFDNFFYFVVGISVGTAMFVYGIPFVIEKLQNGLHYLFNRPVTNVPRQKNGQVDWQKFTQDNRDIDY